MNGQLYGMMQKRFSSNNNFNRLTQFTPHGVTALEYLYHIIETSTVDWIVNCDEDCFVADEMEILYLIQFMQANNYAYCGMPEGGVCVHRTFSWTNVNPFFNVFNAKKIRELLAVSNKDEILHTGHNEWKLKEHLILCDIDHSKVEHISYEIFSGFLFWLSQNFKGIYLNCKNHNDGISTCVFGLTGNLLAKHSWYSRDFNTTHHQRILNLYAEVENIE